MRRILLLMLFVMAACGHGPKVYSGTIVHLDYEPAYTSITNVCSSYDSNGSCTGYYTQITYHEQEWTVTLRSCPEHGKCKEDWYSIGESLWNELKLGQEWTVPEGYR